VILVWDNLNTHISAAMRAFTGAQPDWLTEARLPAYAPDLNAVERPRQWPAVSPWLRDRTCSGPAGRTFL